MAHREWTPDPELEVGGGPDQRSRGVRGIAPSVSHGTDAGPWSLDQGVRGVGRDPPRQPEGPADMGRALVWLEALTC